MPAGNTESSAQPSIDKPISAPAASSRLLHPMLRLALFFGLFLVPCLAQDQHPEFLYAIENPNAPSIVEVFQIDNNTGALTSLSATTSTGMRADYLLADPQSKFLFVGTARQDISGTAPPSVLSFGIDAAGALTPAGQINLPNGDMLNGLAIDSTGRDLYASTMLLLSKGTVSPLLVDRDSGSLSELAPPPDNILMPGQLVLHPGGRFLYAAVIRRRLTADAGGFDLYLRDPATGALTYPRQQTPNPPLFTYFTDTVTALGGRFLVGIDTSGAGHTLAVNDQTGDLTLTSSISGSSVHFQGVAADQTGRFVIFADSSGEITSYAVTSDGTLTLAGSAAAAPNVSHLTVDTSNRFVYVESPGSAQIFAFTFDASSGALAPVAGSPFATTATPIRMDTAAPTSSSSGCGIPSQPSVVICEPANNANEGTFAHVVAAANAPNFALLRVYRNNINVYDTTSQTLDINLGLVPGENHIVLVAYDGVTGTPYVAERFVNSSGSGASVCTAPSTDQTIDICYPNENTNTGATFLLQAHARWDNTVITHMRVYVDGQPAFDEEVPDDGYINPVLTVSAGTHQIVVVAWDINGGAIASPVRTATFFQ